MLNLIFEFFLSFNLLLDSLVVECSLRVRDVPASIPSQGPRHTKDVIKMVPVVPLFSTQHWKGKYWLFLKNLGKKKIMKWIKFGIEILRSRRSLAVVAGMKKTNDHAEPTKDERLKKISLKRQSRHVDSNIPYPYINNRLFTNNSHWYMYLCTSYSDETHFPTMWPHAYLTCRRLV